MPGASARSSASGIWILSDVSAVAATLTLVSEKIDGGNKDAHERQRCTDDAGRGHHDADAGGAKWRDKRGGEEARTRREQESEQCRQEKGFRITDLQEKRGGMGCNEKHGQNERAP